MMLHYTFYILYLIGLSWGADRYHKNLKKIGAFQKLLQFPGAKKEIIWKEKDVALLKLKKDKWKAFYVLASIGFIHEILTLISIANVLDFDVTDYSWFFAPVSVLVSTLMLLVIFWLKGKRVGVYQTIEEVISRLVLLITEFALPLRMICIP